MRDGCTGGGVRTATRYVINDKATRTVFAVVFFSNNERITTGRNINCVESCGPNDVALVSSSSFVYMFRIDL
jgi:hypothetical protein